MKKIFYILLGMSLSFAGTIYALPYFRSDQTIVPFQDNAYDLGTSTAKWRNVYITGSDGCITLTGGVLTSTGSACGSGGGSGGGTWSTTTSSVAGRLINYPNNTSDIVVIGSNATTSGKYWFDPNTLNALIGNSNTASTTIMGIVNFPTTGQGLFYGGTGGKLNAIATTSASCSGSVSCTAFTVIGSSPITITGSGGASDGYGFTTDSYAGNTVQSTTTALWLKSLTPYSLIASSTLFTYASTTQLDVTGTATTTINGALVMQHPYYITVHGLRGDASDGLTIVSNNYTQVANLGAGGGSSATFYGGVNIDGSTRLATSLTGLAYLTAGTVSATGTPQLTVGNLLATSTTATSTFLGNVLISPTNSQLGFPYSGQIFKLVDSQASAPVQGVAQNISTGAAALSSWTLANANTVWTSNPFTTSYYCGQYMAGSGFALYPGLSPNDMVSVCSDSNVRFAALSNNVASSSITFSVGPGFTSANYDVGIYASSTLGKGFVGIGTTTPRTFLHIKATTTSQVTLEGSDTDTMWNVRSIGGNLYVASSSPTTFATTSTALLEATGGVNGTTTLRNLIEERTFVIGDGSNAITTGAYVGTQALYGGKIVEWSLFSNDSSNTACSVTMDLWKTSYGSYPPSVANTITASAKPSLTSANKNFGSPTGWTTTVSEGDFITPNVDSVSGCTRIVLKLKIKRQ